MVAAPRQRTLVFVFYILYVITQVTPAESYPVASRWAQVGPPLETGLRSGDLNVFFSDKLFARKITSSDSGTFEIEVFVQDPVAPNAWNGMGGKIPNNTASGAGVLDGYFSMSLDGTRLVSGSVSARPTEPFISTFAWNSTSRLFARPGADMVSIPSGVFPQPNGGTQPADILTTDMPGPMPIISGNGQHMVNIFFRQIVNTSSGLGDMASWAQRYTWDPVAQAWSPQGAPIQGPPRMISNPGTDLRLSHDGSTFGWITSEFNSNTPTRFWRLDVYRWSQTSGAWSATPGGAVPGITSWTRNVDISSDGTTFVVGLSPCDTTSCSGPGSVRVYRLNPSVSSYARIGGDIVPPSSLPTWDSNQFPSALHERFGDFVSVSGDGSTVAVSAPTGFSYLDPKLNLGSIRIYSLSSESTETATWVQVADGGVNVEPSAVDYSLTRAGWFGVRIRLSDDGGSLLALDSVELVRRFSRTGSPAPPTISFIITVELRGIDKAATLTNAPRLLLALGAASGIPASRMSFTGISPSSTGSQQQARRQSGGGSNSSTGVVVNITINGQPPGTEAPNISASSLQGNLSAQGFPSGASVGSVQYEQTIASTPPPTPAPTTTPAPGSVTTTTPPPSNTTTNNTNATNATTTPAPGSTTTPAPIVAVIVPVEYSNRISDIQGIATATLVILILAVVGVGVYAACVGSTGGENYSGTQRVAPTSGDTGNDDNTLVGRTKNALRKMTGPKKGNQSALPGSVGRTYIYRAV